MIYRRVNLETDSMKIKELLEKHGIRYDNRVPLLGFVAVSEPEDEIIGFIYAHQCALIEPFVCENSTAGVKLNFLMEGALSALGFKATISHIKSEDQKLENEIIKAGYREIFRNGFKLFKKESV